MENGSTTTVYGPTLLKDIRDIVDKRRR